jgi:DNA-binding NtrC family response regulator
LDDSAISWLEQQTWPGNVRQLTQTVERAALMSSDPILSIHDFHTQGSATNEEFDESNLPIGSLTLDEVEKLMVKKAIKAYNNNLSKVAEALGISRSALYRRIEKHDLSS